MKRKRWYEHYALSCCGEDITPPDFSWLTAPAMSTTAAAEAAKRGYEVYLVGTHLRGHQTYCEQFSPSGTTRLIVRR